LAKEVELGVFDILKALEQLEVKPFDTGVVRRRASASSP